MLGFRLLLGLRTALEIALGISRYPSRKFFLINGIGALPWALLMTGLGFVVGHAVEAVMGRLECYEGALLAAIVMVELVIWLRRVRRKCKIGRATQSGV